MPGHDTSISRWRQVPRQSDTRPHGQRSGAYRPAQWAGARCLFRPPGRAWRESACCSRWRRGRRRDRRRPRAQRRRAEHVGHRRDGFIMPTGGRQPGRSSERHRSGRPWLRASGFAGRYPDEGDRIGLHAWSGRWLAAGARPLRATVIGACLEPAISLCDEACRQPALADGLAGEAQFGVYPPHAPSSGRKEGATSARCSINVIGTHLSRPKEGATTSTAPRGADD
jgi:hypothetical protein